MISTLTIVHVIVCILLIIVVLLQFGKGAETGLLDAASGGTNFGPKGNLLSKTTVVLSILFLGLCITLAKLRSSQVQKSIFDDQAAKAKPLNMDLGQPAQEPATDQAPAATQPSTDNTDK
jgi:preprotein translocase subunit SecG